MSTRNNWGLHGKKETVRHSGCIALRQLNSIFKNGPNVFFSTSFAKFSRKSYSEEHLGATASGVWVNLYHQWLLEINKWHRAIRWCQRICNWEITNFGHNLWVIHLHLFCWWSLVFACRFSHPRKTELDWVQLPQGQSHFEEAVYFLH